MKTDFHDEQSYSRLNNQHDQLAKRLDFYGANSQKAAAGEFCDDEYEKIIYAGSSASKYNNITSPLDAKAYYEPVGSQVMYTPDRRYRDDINDSSAVRGFYEPYRNDRSVLSASRKDGYQGYNGRGAVPDASAFSEIS